MRIYGIDFTSSPSRKKPITCLVCDLENGLLTAKALMSWENFIGFEAHLSEPGPWIAGIDFPFGQSRRFIENIGWPQDWAEYVRHTGSLGKEGFISALNAYKHHRLAGDKEHRRKTDVQAGSISPQKLFGVPVGKMFFEGAPRLLVSGVTLPGIHTGDPERIVVEAYPGVIARFLGGGRSYKSDTKKKQSVAQHEARQDIFAALSGENTENRYGFRVEAFPGLADDPTGDNLDALLCAVQAAWAWTQKNNDYGMPKDADPLEGWIADPLPSY